MQNYELLCVFPGTMAEDAVSTHVEAVAQVLEEQGAKISTKNEMGKSRLAYPMKHIRYGYYVQFLFEAEKESIAPMEKKLRVMPDILRALFQVFDAKKQGEYTKRMAELEAKKEKKTIEEVAKKDLKAEPMAEEENTEEASVEEPVEDIDKKLDELLDKPMETE